MSFVTVASASGRLVVDQPLRAGVVFGAVERWSFASNVPLSISGMGSGYGVGLDRSGEVLALNMAQAVLAESGYIGPAFIPFDHLPAESCLMVAWAMRLAVKTKFITGAIPFGAYNVVSFDEVLTFCLGWISVNGAAAVDRLSAPAAVSIVNAPYFNVSPTVAAPAVF